MTTVWLLAPFTISLLITLAVYGVVQDVQRKVTALAKGAPATKPADGVRDMLDAYRAAGFTDEQARDLAQEAIRVEVRKQGGWTP